jgi:4-oxalomesaconate tautomerase
MKNMVGVPCLYMRGGTSKGPYFKGSDLPVEREIRDRFLLAAMGSPDLRQIDGLGGADTLTSKVAIVTPSTRPGVDVDYHFCQVDIAKPLVDTNPSCGNMLSGVGPFAIESGLVMAKDGHTRVVIFDVNTQSKIEAVIETPGGSVNYIGDARIDGVPGSAAPVILNFMDIVGSKTGKMLPSGHAMEKIDGIDVTLIDVCMPMMLLRAKDVGLTGYEGRKEIDGNKELLARIEKLRLEAGRRMTFGDVSDKVIPKVGLLSPPRDAMGAITSRYLTPHALHAAHAVTGGCCVATACALEGSVAHELVRMPAGNPRTIWIEHPTGMMDIRLETKGSGPTMEVICGVLRTARPIMRGEVLVPKSVMESAAKMPAGKAA